MPAIGVMRFINYLFFVFAELQSREINNEQFIALGSRLGPRVFEAA